MADRAPSAYAKQKELEAAFERGKFMGRSFMRRQYWKTMGRLVLEGAALGLGILIPFTLAAYILIRLAR